MKKRLLEASYDCPSTSAPEATNPHHALRREGKQTGLQGHGWGPRRVLPMMSING